MLTKAKEKSSRSWLKSDPPGLTNLTNTDLEAENVPGLHNQKTQQASMKGRKRGSSELEERLQPMVGGGNFFKSPQYSLRWVGATRDVHAASNAGASTRAVGGKGDLKGKQWKEVKETGTTS